MKLIQTEHSFIARPNYNLKQHHQNGLVHPASCSNTTQPATLHPSYTGLKGCTTPLGLVRIPPRLTIMFGILQVIISSRNRHSICGVAATRQRFKRPRPFMWLLQRNRIGIASRLKPGREEITRWRLIGLGDEYW
jgi:hypothetical protein